jgi:hypothetical protein
MLQPCCLEDEGASSFRGTCSAGHVATCPNIPVWFASGMLIQGTTFAGYRGQQKCLAATVDPAFYNSVAPPGEELLAFESDCHQKRPFICMKEQGELPNRHQAALLSMHPSGQNGGAVEKQNPNSSALFCCSVGVLSVVEPHHKW